MNENPETETRAREAIPFRNALGPLLALCGIFCLNFLARVIFSPLLVTIEEDLHISHGEAGGLVFLASLGYCVSLLGSGFVAARFTHRRLITFSGFSVAAGLALVASAGTLNEVQVALVVMGLASGLFLPSAIASITDMVVPRDWGKAIAFHETAPNLGFVAAPLLAEALLGLTSWRGVLWVLAAASALASLLYIRFGRGGRFRGDPPNPAVLGTLFRVPSFWVLMGLFTIAIGASYGVYMMTPTFLAAERGMDGDWANTLVALSRMPGVFTAYLGGWVADRLGIARTMRIFFIVSGVPTLLMGWAQGGWVVLAVVIQPLFAVLFFPAALAALAHMTTPGSRSLAVAIVIPIATFLGGGAVPAALGIAGEMGSFALGFTVLGVVVVLGLVVLRFLHLKDDD